LGPAEVTDNGNLRIALPLLDLADVENRQPSAGPGVDDVGDVQAVAVVADVHPVGDPLRPQPDRHRNTRIGDVEGGDGVTARRADPERVAVWREGPLVAEDAERRARLERRMQAVLAD